MLEKKEIEVIAKSTLLEMQQTLNINLQSYERNIMLSLIKIAILDALTLQLKEGK